MPTDLPELSSHEQARYQWQMWIPGFGEPGQRKLKAATVMISRVGGLGGTVAYYLAAAGIGRLILAHAGNVQEADLNRQLLMTSDWVGKPRLESARRRLLELNPHVEIETVLENVSAANADGLVARADVVVDAAPMFQERLAMNGAAVRQGKPLVEAAMYDLEAQLTVVLPGRTACLACWCPEPPATWTRQFPVLGAVSGTIGAMAAIEVVKVLTGLAEPLAGRILQCDLRDMAFRTLSVARNPQCSVCRGV